MGQQFHKFHGLRRFSTAGVRLLTWADRTPLPITTRKTGNTSAMTSDRIGNTSRRSRWTGNEWRQSIGSGSAERVAIYSTRPTVAKPWRQLEPRPTIAAREPRRRTAPGLESRAGVDIQRCRGRLASRRGRREGANRPGRNGIFGLGNFGPLCGHIGCAATHGSSVAPQTNFIDVFWRVVSDHPGCFPAWRQ